MTIPECWVIRQRIASSSKTSLRFRIKRSTWSILPSQRKRSRSVHARSSRQPIPAWFGVGGWLSEGDEDRQSLVGSKSGQTEYVTADEFNELKSEFTILSRRHQALTNDVGRLRRQLASAVSALRQSGAVVRSYADPSDTRVRSTIYS